MVRKTDVVDPDVINSRCQSAFDEHIAMPLLGALASSIEYEDDFWSVLGTNITSSYQYVNDGAEVEGIVKELGRLLRDHQQQHQYPQQLGPDQRVRVRCVPDEVHPSMHALQLELVTALSSSSSSSSSSSVRIEIIVRIPFKDAMGLSMDVHKALNPVVPDITSRQILRTNKEAMPGHKLHQQIVNVATVADVTLLPLQAGKQRINIVANGSGRATATFSIAALVDTSNDAQHVTSGRGAQKARRKILFIKLSRDHIFEMQVKREGRLGGFQHKAR